MKNIFVEHDIAACKRLWEQFSPDKTIYDDWDFRHIFYNPFQYPLHFIHWDEGGEAKILLALQWNTDRKFFEFFGGSYMEENKIFFKDSFQKHIPALFSSIEKPIYLSEVTSNNPFTEELPITDYKYFLHLKKYDDVNDFLSKHFKGESLKKIRSQMKKIESLPVIVKENINDNVEFMFQTNKENFGKDSTFHKPHREAIFRELLNRSKFTVQLLSFCVEDELQAVTFSIHYKNTYIGMNSGTKKTAYPNLGKYAILEKIRRAMSLKCEIYDASVTDCNWKEKWKFEKLPQRTLNTSSEPTESFVVCEA